MKYVDRNMSKYIIKYHPICINKTYRDVQFERISTLRT